MSRGLAAAWLLAAGMVGGLAAGAARAHVVVQRPGLRQLLQSAEVAVVVEFVSSLRTWEAPHGADRQEYFTVRTLETIAGEAPPARFDVFPHAEGMPAWQQGDVALLFLERTSLRPEFASLATRFPYFTIQQTGQEWKLVGRDGKAVLAAARAYRALGEKTAAEGSTALRSLLLLNLRSGGAPLREDAVAELVRVRSVPGFFGTPRDLDGFTALVARDAGLPLTTRVALARILDGLHGFSGDREIRAITTEPLSAEERLQLVRVSGAAQDAGVSAWLAGLLASPDATLRREAAYALGHPWHAARAQALAATLEDPDPTVARAALRSLGALESSDAADMLQRVANGPECFLKHLAQAEIRRIAAISASPSAPRERIDTQEPQRPLP